MSHFGSPPEVSRSITSDCWILNEEFPLCFFVILPLVFPFWSSLHSQKKKKKEKKCFCRVSVSMCPVRELACGTVWFSGVDTFCDVRLEVRGLVFKGSEGDSMETADLPPYTNKLCYFMILGKKSDSLLLSVLHTLLISLWFFILSLSREMHACDCAGFNQIHLKGSIKINVNMKSKSCWGLI